MLFAHVFEICVRFAFSLRIKASKVWGMKANKTLQTVLLCSTLLAGSGCSIVVKRVGNSFSGSLNAAVMNHDDLELVRDGAPSYMLLMDSILARKPSDPAAYSAAANLYSAYAGVFVQDQARALRLSDRAFDYAQTGLCLDVKALCNVDDLNFEDFEAGMKSVKKADLATLYTTATVWAGWVQLRKDDWGAIAHLAKITAMMEKVVEIDPAYEDGKAQMYMGVLESLVPPAAGGDLEKAKMHFENADEMSDGKNLFVKVLLAENYARMMFEQELHDTLLKDVLKADPHAEGYTLMNVVAQQRAKELLETSDEYFN